MLGDTLEKFGYPKSLVKEYQHWAVLLRPKQVTLGSLIVICKEQVDSFSDISPAAFSEFERVIRDVESNLYRLFAYDKINHMMLMMTDPEVHFHVIPRYAGLREFHGNLFGDHSWPGVPNLANGLDIVGEIFDNLVTHLRENWN